MARYFFNVVQGNNILEDEEGSELPDLETVRKEADASAREIMAMNILSGDHMEDRAIWVRDERGQTVLMLPFRELLG